MLYFLRTGQLYMIEIIFTTTYMLIRTLTGELVQSCLLCFKTSYNNYFGEKLGACVSMWKQAPHPARGRHLRQNFPPPPSSGHIFSKPYEFYFQGLCHKIKASASHDINFRKTEFIERANTNRAVMFFVTYTM